MTMNRRAHVRLDERMRETRPSWIWSIAIVAVAVLLGGCSLDGLLNTDEVPPDVTDPAITQTTEGALRAYHGVLVQFREIYAGSKWGTYGFTPATGLLTDELEWGGNVQNTSGDVLDIRYIPEDAPHTVGSVTYGELQKIRGLASQAIGLMTRFAPDSLAPLVGHLYALQAYAEIFLAELFCSGIPLSTLDYEGGFTYAPGSTTEEVFEHALALLDTALTFVGDSARFENLAHVGRARALLGLGRIAEAAAAVATVPDNFRYDVRYSVVSGSNAENFARLNLSSPRPWDVTVGDGEGGNGLPYVSSGDPRTQVTSTWGTNSRGLTIHHPSKYGTDGSGMVTLASGVEARLIEAEAALHAKAPDWLDRLNHPRQTLWTTIVPAVAGPLPDLADPGTDDARLDLIFRERAYWLFLTGHRQGDLRRLVSTYGRAQQTLYPVGAYHDPYAAGLSYGSHIDLPVPAEEKVSNKRYTGCIARA